MKKSNFAVLLILLMVILTFVSCSSGDNTTKYDYCVYMEKEICLSGSYETCPNGGTPSNTCPSGYDKGSPTENNSSSSKNIFGGSSSSYSSSSIGSNNNSSSSISGGYKGEYGSVQYCNQTYKTVVIGTQTWFAENVNCPTTSGSKCYRNELTNCSKFGRLYDLETAITVCPTGWHLPDSTEWKTLINYAGGKEIAGKKLRANNGWNDRDDGMSGNGTNDFGFSALPGGSGYISSKDASEGSFSNVGNRGNWWSASWNASDYATYYYYISIRLDTDAVRESDDSKNEKGEDSFYSVRCVKN